MQLLSEEIFDFGRGEMTQARIDELKQSLNKARPHLACLILKPSPCSLHLLGSSRLHQAQCLASQDFQQIHELCEFVLDRTQRVDLVRATLHCLHAYLSWVPLQYIFGSTLIVRLLNLFPHSNFRNLVLQCMTEIGGLYVDGQYQEQLEKIFLTMMTKLQEMLPPTVDIRTAYKSGSDAERGFVLYLAQFFKAFLSQHMRLFEGKQDYEQALQTALQYMVKMSYVENTEIFKVCLEFWQWLVTVLYNEEIEARSARHAGSNIYAFPSAQHAAETAERRQNLYAHTLSHVRALMIARMAKPEEVIVVEDENGSVVKETLKDNETITQHKSMKETLVYLAHLNQQETEQLMLERLSEQLMPENYSTGVLNTLCWAVGAISGTMEDAQEDKFLVSVIRDLLRLCENTRAKDDKATIASNIMYVVGQYPRFLREHWRFLKTVVNKLFEFMHEPHPGVQDMACETFLKIAKSCKRKFVITERGENEPFLDTLANNLEETTRDLEQHQLRLFYEAGGIMASAADDPHGVYLLSFMGPLNDRWDEIMAEVRRREGQSGDSLSALIQEKMIRQLANLLELNISMCKGMGGGFEPQFNRMFTDMLTVYNLFSKMIGALISEKGVVVARSPEVKLMRGVKREVLQLIEAYNEHCFSSDRIVNRVVPGTVEPVLGDYASNIPEARDSEVLSVFASILRRVGPRMGDYVPRLLDATFKCTLDMIANNFEDYPEHRLKFYVMLKELVDNCFDVVAQMPEEQQKMLVDASVWGIKHQERNVADTALNMVYTMVKRFSESNSANVFMPKHCFTLLTEVFNVMTDSFHKPGFKMQAHIIRLFLLAVDSPMLTVPLWDTNTLGNHAYVNNAKFLRSSIISLLCNAFPHMEPTDVQESVDGMFTQKQDFTAFKSLVRDFLVQTMQFKQARDSNRDMYDDGINVEMQRLEFNGTYQPQHHQQR